MKISNSISGILGLALFAGLLIGIAYYTPRESFTYFFAQYTAAFALFLLVYNQLIREKFKLNFNQIILIAIAVRLVLFFAAPQLSNDFFRFIWDGELMTHGINPFSEKPDNLLYGQFYSSEYMRVLYHGMGELSQEHYSCYPVINQFLFWPGALVSDDIFLNILSLRTIIIFFDFVAIIYAGKILKELGVSINNVWLYALNPFIILEFTGNLHFEGVMIAFLLMAIYYLIKLKWLIGGFLMAMAVHVKLTPLMLLPFFFKKLKWRGSVGFTATVALGVIAIGAVLMNEELFANMMDSVNEYFIKFEFNASLFYIGREISFATTGWDTILYMGPAFSALSTISILLLAFLRKYESNQDILVGILFAYMIYYSLATTVHPWYVAMPLVISIFTHYRFPLVWSFFVMLSYSAYGESGFQENLYLVTVEYLTVFGFMIYELKKHSRKGIVALQLKSFFKDQAQ